MPVIVLIKKSDAPVPDDPGKWYDGQCVVSYSQQPEYAQHFFGFSEMPVRSDNPITVQALNNRNPNSYKKFTSFKMLNSGLIDVGLNNLEVQEDDVVVRQEDGIFINYRSEVRAVSTPDDDKFYQFQIADRTVEDMRPYVQGVFETVMISPGPDAPPGTPLVEDEAIVSRSKYKITQAGMSALANNDGILEGNWADFEQYFEDQYP